MLQPHPQNTYLGKILSRPTIPGHPMQVSLRTSCRTVEKESPLLGPCSLVPTSPSPSVLVVAAVLGTPLSPVISLMLGEAVVVVEVVMVVVALGVVDAGAVSVLTLVSLSVSKPLCPDVASVAPDSVETSHMICTHSIHQLQVASHMLYTHYIHQLQVASHMLCTHYIHQLQVTSHMLCIHYIHQLQVTSHMLCTHMLLLCVCVHNWLVSQWKQYELQIWSSWRNIF